MKNINRMEAIAICKRIGEAAEDGRLDIAEKEAKTFLGETEKSILLMEIKEEMKEAMHAAEDFENEMNSFASNIRNILSEMDE